MSQRATPTEAGELNRQAEEEKGRRSGTNAEFGQSIGRSEDSNEGGSESDFERNGIGDSTSGRH